MDPRLTTFEDDDFVQKVALKGLKTRVVGGAWINLVAYPDLSPRERHRFVQTFLRDIRAKGFIGAIEWTKDYYPKGPFSRAHFLPYFRSVNMYSLTFNPEISLAKVRECNEILV